MNAWQRSHLDGWNNFCTLGKGFECSHLPRHGGPWRQQSQHREGGEPLGLAQGWELSSKPESALALLRGCMQVFLHLPLYWESMSTLLKPHFGLYVYKSWIMLLHLKKKKKALYVHWRTSLSLVSGTIYITEVKGTEEVSSVTFVHLNVHSFPE